RSHQVPLSGLQNNPDHLRQLEAWLRSYGPDELFTAEGCLVPELQELAPQGARRGRAHAHANGGVLPKGLRLPDFRDYAIEVKNPGGTKAESTQVLGGFLRDVMKKNLKKSNFLVFGPDENASNRLAALYEVTGKRFLGPYLPVDENLAADGRVIEVL